MRDTLGRYLQIAPEKVEFTYNSRGKPALSPSRSGRGLHFNLAHSEDLALLAITSVGAIGADVESIRPVKDVDDLVARFFSPRESELFQKLPDKQKPPAFFNLWTRKEALLKATGQGITGSLSEVEVAFLPGEEARVLAMSGAPETATRWMLRELVPASGFVGAVAIETAGQVSILSLKCFGYGAGTMCQSVQ